MPGVNGASTSVPSATACGFFQWCGHSHESAIITLYKSLYVNDKYDSKYP